MAYLALGLSSMQYTWGPQGQDPPTQAPLQAAPGYHTLNLSQGHWLKVHNHCNKSRTYL